MRIGITELIVVFIVALFAIGPDRLPAFARKLGQAVSQFKKYSEEAAQEIKESVVEPLEEVQAPLREAVKPLEDLDRSVRADVKDLKDAFNGIGKDRKPDSGAKAGEPSEQPAAEAESVPAAASEPEAAPEPEGAAEQEAEAAKAESPA